MNLNLNGLFFQLHHSQDYSNLSFLCRGRTAKVDFISIWVCWHRTILGRLVLSFSLSFFREKNIRKELSASCSSCNFCYHQAIVPWGYHSSDAIHKTTKLWNTSSMGKFTSPCELIKSAPSARNWVSKLHRFQKWEPFDSLAADFWSRTDSTVDILS